MQIVSLNIGKIAPLEVGSRSLQSGIDKRPVDGPVALGEQGFEGDEIANLEAHGGPDQAVYLVRSEDYSWWGEQLERPLAWGQLGENLALAGLPEDLWVGDTLTFGEVVLQLTAPRIPCAKLAARMGRPGFVKEFVQARRPGAYARVLQPGTLRAGQRGSYRPGPRPGVTVADVFDLWYTKSPDRQLLLRARRSPLAERARAGLDRLHGPDMLAESYAAATPQQLREVYGRWAPHYDVELQESGWDKPSLLVGTLVELGCPRGMALDVGAGTGLVGAELRRQGWEPVDALDFSPQMLEQARARGCYRKLIEHDLGQPLELQGYPLVVAVGLFTQGHAPPEVLERLLGWCLPQGWLAFSLRDDLADELGFSSLLQQWQRSGRADLRHRKTFSGGLGDHPWSAWVMRRQN